MSSSALRTCTVASGGARCEVGGDLARRRAVVAAGAHARDDVAQRRFRRDAPGACDRDEHRLVRIERALADGALAQPPDHRHDGVAERDLRADGVAADRRGELRGDVGADGGEVLVGVEAGDEAPFGERKPVEVEDGRGRADHVGRRRRGAFEHDAG